MNRTDPQQSPVYQAVWNPATISPNLFAVDTDEVPPPVQRVMSQSLDVLRQHRERGTLRGPDGKHSAEVLNDLATAGYWGLLVDRQYGGSGAALRHVLPFLTQAAVIDQPLAGLAAVHGCIGAVNPLQSFGSDGQKETWLPALASGKKLSAFASTEPGAGSDLRGVQTRAVRTVTGWEITGQKAFITNLAPGRTIGLLCKVDDELTVFILDLPDSENEHFRVVPNPLHPLKHTIKQGMMLRNFPAPPEARLASPPGKDGRAIVFHGLNRGRAAIAALAAGHLRNLLAGMIAWAGQRRVHGRPLAELELIQARCARVAALIAGCDALANWCGTLLDAGHRGEIECLIAKIFASEAVKHAAFDLALPTHGGRFFLQGHPSGDFAYDYLAPCIYEGENDLLRLALIQALVRHPPRPSSGSIKPADWFGRAWQRVQSQLNALVLTAQKTSPTTHGELVELARQIIALTTYGATQAAGGQNAVDRPGADLLCRQLQLQIRSKRATTAHYRAEIRLGQELVTHQPPWLQDSATYYELLQSERLFREA
jgi:alkylation response protein AidB-like acyl-CoA dehydrogenase